MNGKIKRKVMRCTVSVLAFLMAGLIAGCANEQPQSTDISTIGTSQPTEGMPGIAWQENSKVSFSEPYPYSEPHATLTGTVAQMDGAKYYFDDGIAEEVREGVIQKIEETIGVVKEVVGGTGNSCEVYISNGAYQTRAYENQLYVGLENLDTQDTTVGIIQMLYGYQINYGLAYALSCDVADRLGLAYDDNEIALADALAFAAEEPAYLDLNYACFSNSYSNEEQLKNIKSLACHFYDYLRQEDKLDIYSRYTDKKYCGYLNQFLAAHSALTYDNSGLAETIFFNGGTKTQMAWKNHVAEFYIEDGYAVTYYDNLFTEDMVNSGYANLRKIVVDYIAQADYMQAVLKDCEVQTKELTVLFIEDRANSVKYGAVYMMVLNEVRLFSATAFMHEYTHYLTEGWVDGWKCEVLPVYYNNYPVDEQITYFWYDDMLKRTSLDPNDPEEAEDYAFIQKVFASLDHEFDWTDMDDFQYLLDALLVKRDWLDRITEVNGGTATKSSFFHYLCRTYGEQTALFTFMHDDPEGYMGMTWEELLAGWKDDVNVRLAWVNKP